MHSWIGMFGIFFTAENYETKMLDYLISCYEISETTKTYDKIK